MTFDLADRGIYGFATAENLRFADLDANGHINNGSFFELLENARVSYLRQIVRSGLPRFRLVIGRIEADFKRQMFFPGTATACARLVEVHDAVELLADARLDVVRQALDLRPVDDADRAAQARSAQLARVVDDERRQALLRALPLLCSGFPSPPTTHLRPAYKVRRNSISPLSSRQGQPSGPPSVTSQLASALAFISKSTSA